MEALWDEQAERAVLSACLLSPMARTRARRSLDRNDFYSIGHEQVWVAMGELDAAKHPVDPVSVASALAGQRPALTCLPDIATVVAIPEHVTTYAETVRAWGVRRRAVDVAIRIRNDAHNPAIDPYTLTAEALTRITELRENGTTDDIRSRLLADLLDQPDDPYEWVVPGLLETRDRLVLTGDEGLGKEVSLDTPIVTPSGWSTMGRIEVGDLVVAADGTPCRVTHKSDVEYPAAGSWRVSFSDGATVLAGGDHQWVTWDLKAREQHNRPERTAPLKPRGTDQRGKRRAHLAEVRTTDEIRRTLRARGGHVTNHAVRVAGALDLPQATLPVDPYLLGAWLGDGTAATGAISVAHRDSQIVQGLGECHVVPSSVRDGCSSIRVEGLTAGLREAGVLGDKHIPTAYLRASVAQRKDLLAGICDTDGYCPDSSGEGRGTGDTSIEVCLTNKRLAYDVYELVASLGAIPKMYEGRATIGEKDYGTKYRIYFTSPFNPFRHATFKAERWAPARTGRSTFRYITSVERVPDVPMACIQVEHPSGTYLVGREMVATHNSHLARQVGIFSAAGIHPFQLEERFEPKRVQILDYENSWSQVRRGSRNLAAFARHHGEDPGPRVHVASLPRIDITRDKDLMRIHRELDASRPDVVIVGPLYRLTTRAIQTDDEAVPVLAALDTIRDRGCVLVLEAHAGHTKGTSGERDLRPRGSSALLGWPEFGYGMRRLVDGRVRLVPWRGDRDARGWPVLLRRSRDPHASHYLPDASGEVL